MTYEVEAVIQAIWPCVMPRSCETATVIIWAVPARKDVVAVATVAMNTKDISCSVLAKHSGRSPNFDLTRVRGAVPPSTSTSGSPSFESEPTEMGSVFSMLSAAASAIFDTGSTVLAIVADSLSIGEVR